MPAYAEVVYGDAGYQEARSRADIIEDQRPSRVQFRIAARMSKLTSMVGPERARLHDLWVTRLATSNDHAKERGLRPWAIFDQPTGPKRCLPLLRR